MTRRERDQLIEVAKVGAAAGAFAVASNLLLRKLGLGFNTRAGLLGVAGVATGAALTYAGHSGAGLAIGATTLTQSMLYAAMGSGLLEPLENRIMNVAPYYGILYGGSSLTALWANQKPISVALDQRGIVLHGSSDQLIHEAPAVAADIRATLPKADIWYELEDDDGPANSAQQLVRRVSVADAAVANRIPVLSLDRERRWKTGGPGFSPDDARNSIDAIRAKHPSLGLLLTNYDQPTLHLEFPWAANAGVDAYGPEVYGSGPQGEYARFIAHAESWATARKMGIVSGAPTYPFVPAGGITYTEMCWMADGADTILMWVMAPPGTNDTMILDSQGKQAILLLNRLADLNYVGRGRVARFQRDNRLAEMDGKIGPITRAALGV